MRTFTAIEADVLKHRKRIMELNNERDAVLQAPIPLAEIEERVDRLLDTMLAGYKLNARAFCDREMDRNVDFIHDGIGRVQDGLVRISHKPVEAFVAYATRATLRVAIMRDVTLCLSSLGDPVTEDERAARVQRIDEAILEAEFAEERAIMESEAAGYRSITRRADADPRALALTEWKTK